MTILKIDKLAERDELAARFAVKSKTCKALTSIVAAEQARLPRGQVADHAP